MGRPETRRCLSADEMSALGFSKNAAGFWITRKRPDSAPHRTRQSGDRTEGVLRQGINDSATGTAV